jgi:hypothetical protein
MGQSISQFGFESLVLGLQLTEMRLKTHAILH